MSTSPTRVIPPYTSTESTSPTRVIPPYASTEPTLSSDEDLRTTIAVENLFRAAYVNQYKELTYAAGDLTQVDIWDTVSKTTKQFTKTLTYSSGQLIQTVTTDNIEGTVLTATLSYSINGDLVSITKAIT